MLLSNHDLGHLLDREVYLGAGASWGGMGAEDDVCYRFGVFYLFCLLTSFCCVVPVLLVEGCAM